MNNKQDFSKVTIGQKLWCIQLGDCEVLEVHTPKCYLDVKSLSRISSYYFSGKVSIYDKHQSLFFSNPNIIAPPPPDRKITLSESEFNETFLMVNKKVFNVYSNKTVEVFLKKLKEELGF